ncbi:peptide deformylase [Dysgonomonas sp. PFB1-18]|uniref:peptide deformylase n=1 Tax=unclassified Dysgonomonas TaxID=2630389 RepID=UPI0024736A17|nr:MULTISPECIES: peptide deformylase [unclassified Dysgonomonas]MDL2303145.1 peptide deformylase [Dysgonomonas sp. OttesenSCG-928-D17]MDH6308167.1 peptide deformylase [Dysgonomonas sp. PF1-14]MDH6338394.1 peptide deformylase [Dysgonomonas sp. PF1-16]MDH6379891.1 peptide deformylase [Dysgonomonas sp. PFB1-18]MDH6397019.1 peptide deformylase [Dysgonomonas sp. PF1-23]
MILPIYLYGQPILRKPTKEITADYPDLKKLIDNMFETMYNADGVGLAAPQIGLDIRLFVIDLEALAEDDPKYSGFKKVFINPRIVEYTGEIVKMEEGCLSIPGINENVDREEAVRIQYFDENFVSHDETYDAFFARCIQHEYDHIEGKLFVDKISGIRKQLIKSKLNNLIKGRTNCRYKVKALEGKI